MNLRLNHRLPGVLLCLLSTLSVQSSSQEDGAQEVNAIAEAESQFLFINMLEFLGEFETEEGEWVSPDILANEAFADLDDTRENQAEAGRARQQNVNLNQNNDNRQ